MSDAHLRSVVAADLDMSAVVDLYTSVGWTAYTNRPDLLEVALAGSSHIVVADLDATLVGLARVVSDQRASPTSRTCSSIRSISDTASVPSWCDPCFDPMTTWPEGAAHR